MSESKIIPINIVFSYPVHWGRYQVLRDLVQNFYDAVEPAQWQDSFHYAYNADKRILSMEIQNNGFSYEWLLHIGASTKRNDGEIHAGYFGEGFKIASLCAMRDFKWGVTMQSRDWILKVRTIVDKIDGRSMQMLAYEIVESDFFQGSRLFIENITEQDYRLFIDVLDSFYYPENKLFGKPIYEDKWAAVYERSAVPLNRHLPVTSQFGTKGAVFCGYQMLGTNPLPLIFCLHDYENADRERNSLLRVEVEETLIEIATIIEPAAAVVILERMRRYWNTSSSTKKIKVEGWSAVVNAFIRRVSISDSAIQDFKSRNPYLLCSEKAITSLEKSRKHQALEWAKRERKNYKIVKYTFFLLGYPFLNDECKKAGGFIKEDRDPSGIEIRYIDILETTVRSIYSDFFPIQDQFPPVKIIVNETAVMRGLASLSKIKGIEKNCDGYRIRYKLHCVHLKEKMMKPNSFDMAVSTYIHELCHVFGGDASSNFSAALTTAMEILLEHTKEILDAKIKWLSIAVEEG
ncbi:MAG: hypothetical protein Q4E57_07995 [Eubacteriales bacterium]|nr:hypothetical protein [Eubacteriales bacterium]